MLGLTRRILPVLIGIALIGGAAGASGWRWHLPRGMAPPPVPADNAMTRAKVELGRRLFYDADLSADGTMSCATCHEQHRGFTEGNRSHPGVTGEPGRRNVPGLANIAWFSPLTHADPALTTLEAQVSVPILGTRPVEMGMKDRADEIARRLGNDPCYRAMFAQAFPETRGRIDLAGMARAIASFERTLVSYGSAYDRGALTPEAKAGQALFRRDCAGCHAGPRFTDLGFHRLDLPDPALPDQGLYEKSGNPQDRGKFRTPSLRNVALTGPWWHDGSAASPAEAIARHGNRYAGTEQAALLAFLNALSDRAFTTRRSLALPAKRDRHGRSVCPLPRPR